MKLILVIFIALSITTAKANSFEEKYIDLLPEAEKQAFLEKVARRLINGVRTKDSRYKSSEELSNEELNQHSAFVRQVLNDESDNLRRNVEDEKKNGDSNELSVKGIEKQNLPSDLDDTKHLDLTLRQGRRRKRYEDSENDRKVETVPVKVVYEKDNSESNVKFDDNNNAEEGAQKPLHGDQSSREDIQVRGRRKSRKVNDSPNALHNVISREYTKIVDFEPEDVTEDNQRESEEDETPVQSEKSNSQSVTAIIPIDTDEGEIDGNNSDGLNVKTTDATTDSSEVITIQSTTDVLSTTTTVEVTTELSTINVTENNNVTTTAVEPLTEKPVENSTITDNKLYLRENNDDQHTVNISGNLSVDGVSDKVQLNQTNVQSDVNEETIKNNYEFVAEQKLLSTESPIFSNTDDQSENVQVRNKEDLEGHSDRANAFSNSNEKVSADTKNDDLNRQDTNNDKDTTVNDFKTEKDNADRADTKANNEENKPKNELIDENYRFDDAKSLEKNNGRQEKENNLRNKFKNKFNRGDFYFKQLSGHGSINKEKQVSANVKKTDNGQLRSTINDNTQEHIPNEDGSTSVKNNEIVLTTTENYKEVDLVTPDDSLNKEQVTTSEKNVENVLTTTEKNYATATDNPTLTESSKNESLRANDKKIDAKNINSHKQEVSNDSKNIENSNSDDLTTNVKQTVDLENLPKVIRSNFDSKPNGNLRHRIENNNVFTSKTEEYLVYEIRRDQVPFLKENPESVPQSEESNNNQDQPHYVPVYNYSPNHAYYNAYNRLGPNEDDDQENEKVVFGSGIPDTTDSVTNLKEKDNESDFKASRMFKFTAETTSKPKFKTNVAKTFLNLPLPQLAKKPLFTNTYLKPDDYFDMDYYFGRTNPEMKARNSKSKKSCEFGKCTKIKVPTFPNSMEDDHAYNAMYNKRAKDIISAVRQILYKNNHFGFIQDATLTTEAPKDTTTISHSNEEKTPRKFAYQLASNRTDVVIILPSKNLRNKLDSDEISIDYYFSVDSDKEKQSLLRKKKSADAKNKMGNGKHNDSYTSKLVRKLQRKGQIRRVKKSNSKHVNASKQNEWKKKSGTIKDILAISDPNDVFDHLNKLEKMNMSYMRSANEVRSRDVEVFVTVLRDMIDMDNNALVQFDWLCTTVDVLAALEKLQNLTNFERRGKTIHRSDKNIFKYVLDLYLRAKSSIESHNSDEVTSGHKNLLSRHKNRLKDYLRGRDLIDEVWKYVSGLKKNKNNYLGDLSDFSIFLDELGSRLYDFHNALKHISMVTNYKKQTWYKNLKAIYLENSEDKCILEVLLHLTLTRFFSLLEYSYFNGLEDEYLVYEERNTEHVNRSVDELVFVMKILQVFRNLESNKLKSQEVK